MKKIFILIALCTSCMTPKMSKMKDARKDIEDVEVITEASAAVIIAESKLQEESAESKLKTKDEKKLAEQIDDIKKGDIFVIVSRLIANNTDQTICIASSATISVNAVVEIMGSRDDKFLFQLKSNKSPGNSVPADAIETDLYCIDKRVFLTLSSKVKKGQGAISLLSIPFKFQYKSYNIHPGGSLGAFGGYRFNSKKNKDQGIMLGAFGGLSSVPQNNDVSTVSSSDIKIVPAGGVGAGVVANFNQFQVGLLSGFDFYSNNGRKNNAWLSFSVGFTFLKPATAIVE